MQVDFYHLTRDPAEKLVPVLAQKTLDGGQRMLLVSNFVGQLEKLSHALWQAGPTSFLAHGLAGNGHDEAQPVLISGKCEATNGARFVALTDGEWRDEALGFDRAFYLFTADQIDSARTVWRALSSKDDVTPRYWKQDGGRWVEGP
ncbi:DNA polymerase III subunit chi [Parasphingorhabdus cellanae]|uniref:DNA polymerase III subunit chi n=1 Tax=Parasphingorhabdus cellanae TaxID=2806553 RepID=A0ABX7T5G5_9SPHN|nr:DNA polymerase III subunit chi [Parasphingorhabdus cellanae]QTD56829.1 DNA polymerase III subunit chi [Parasphingorhabdus cellanae]